MNPLGHARAAHAEGRLAEAEALYRTVGPQDPAYPDATIGLATILLQQNRATQAQDLLQQLCAHHPDLPDAHATHGAALQACGHTAAAAQAYETALALAPQHPEAQYGLGTALHLLGRLEEAAACYRRALAEDPDYAEAECALGMASHSLGHCDQAMAAYRRALDIDPDYAEACLGLAAALHAAGRLAEAEAQYRRAAVLPGRQPAAASGLAAVLLARGHHHAALEVLDAALTSAPLAADLHRQRGQILAELGGIGEAAAAFEASLAITPAAATYRDLANCRRLPPGDRHIAAMRALAARAEALPDADQVQLHFALARALTDTGDPAAGFAHLLAGNAMHRRRLHYDEAATHRLFTRIAAIFTPDLFHQRATVGDPAAAPIFIIGMPRSGSTLIEQLLAGHPDVAPGGERPEFGQAVRACGVDTEDMPFPDTVPDLDDAALRRLGADYLARVAAPPGQRPTDKMLTNAVFAGLIHLALPNARIVHARRDPVDTALSCFAELFANDPPFAYDLGELGRYHHAQAALIDHWRRVLPAHTMIDVDYEALVDDLEGQTRRLFAHCGLRWEPAALRFHETQRPVRTASLVQVRRPLYRSSVGRWRPDPATLRPLLDGLAGLG